MSRTPLQTSNLLLLTVAIAMGVLITVATIVMIWVGWNATGGRTIGSAAVVLGAVLVTWTVNALILRRALGRTVPMICWSVTMLCVVGGLVLSLLAIWQAIGGDVVVKTISTLAVLLFASLLALAIAGVAGSSQSAPPKAS